MMCRVSTSARPSEIASVQSIDGQRSADPQRRRALRVVDVALHYGPGFHGLAGYLRAKHDYAERTRELVHHAIVPAAREYHFGNWRELPQPKRIRSGDEQRFGARPTRLLQLLNALSADVVAVHGPFEHAERVLAAARLNGSRTVAVTHHAGHEQTGAAFGTVQRWHERRELRATRHADIVTTPAPAAAPAGSGPVRLGVDPEFRPDPSVRRSQQVVFAGELSHSTGVFALPLAANLSNVLWSGQIIGRGRDARGLQRAIKMFGLTHRITIEPFITDREQLARIFAAAGCVVIPGPATRGQLVALEAAATGTPIVAPEGAPIQTLAPTLAHTFPRTGIEALGKAIQAALSTPPDPQAGERLAEQNSWERAFERELGELRELVDR